MASTPNNEQTPKFLPPHLRRRHMVSIAGASPNNQAESDQELGSEKLASITAGQGSTSLAVAKGTTAHESTAPGSGEEHAGLTVSQGLALLAAAKSNAAFKSKRLDNGEKHVGRIINERLVSLAVVRGNTKYESVVVGDGEHDSASSTRELVPLAIAEDKTSDKQAKASKKEEPTAEDDWVLDSEGMTVGKLQVLTGGLQ